MNFWRRPAFALMDLGTPADKRVDPEKASRKSGLVPHKKPMTSLRGMSSVSIC
jgi:hypothetical protein